MTGVISEMGEDVDWAPYKGGSDTLSLADNEIHLWRAAIDVPPDKLTSLEASLSPDECDRANRFRFPEHRVRFVAARGILRNILGIHTGCDAGALVFGYSEHGKPYLSVPEGAGVEFNVSHSADIALYAVAAQRIVGVDVELIKSDGSWQRIAEHYFSAGESSLLAQLPEKEMSGKFFELWSEKEARLKALGVGLRYPVGEKKDDTQWSVIQLWPKEGYAAAMAFAATATAPLIVKHSFVL